MAGGDVAQFGRLTPLSARDDGAAVQDFILRSADYWAMVQGGPPSTAAAADFFAEGPPGHDLASTRKLGVFQPDGRLAAIADLACGYPDADDVYLGLLVLEPSVRGKGWGSLILADLLADARTFGAKRMLLAVLDENRRARAFWEREGFQAIATLPDVRLGQKTHVVHRMARLITPA